MRQAISWILRVVGTLNIVAASIGMLFGSVSIGPVGINNRGWTAGLITIVGGAIFISIGNFLVRARASPR